MCQAAPVEKCNLTEQGAHLHGCNTVETWTGVPRALERAGLSSQGKGGREHHRGEASFPAPSPAQPALGSNSPWSLGNTLNTKNQVNSIILEKSLRNISSSRIPTNKTVLFAPFRLWFGWFGFFFGVRLKRKKNTEMSRFNKISSLFLLAFSLLA